MGQQHLFFWKKVMLFTERSIIRNIKRDTIINEQDRYSTLDKNFKKKSEGTFRFLDIHSSYAKKYLESNSYFIKNFKSILPITNGEIAISEDDDKLAGYIYIGGGDKYANRNYGFIQTLEVIKKYRGYGLSNKLLEDAIKKYHAIDLVVSVHNEVAVRLYKKHGFVIIGYSSDKKDEYWMKLKSKLDKDDKIIIK